MRKQCSDCLYGGRWGFIEERKVGYLDNSVTDRRSHGSDGDARYFCSLHKTLHKGNKEQRNCKDYERRIKL